MGSWYETCGITHLPIYDDTDVVLFYLTRTPDSKSTSSGGASGSCGANALWSPRSLPFYGKYADCGEVSHIPADDWHTPFFFGTLKEDVIECEAGENKYRKAAVKLDEITDHGDLLRLIHDDRIKLKFYSFQSDLEPPIMGRMLIIRSVYEAMTQKIDSYQPMTLEQMIQDGIDYFNAYKAISENDNGDDNPFGKHNRPWKITMRFESRDEFNYFSRHLRREGGNEIDAYSIRIGIRDYADYLHKLADEGRSADNRVVMGLITELAKFLIFNENINASRRFYMPQNGKGSQDADFDLHKLIAKAGDDYMADITTKYDLDWDEEDEEEVEDETA